jgi:hypothetical protein
MNEVIGGLAPGQGVVEGRAVLDVARRDLDLRARAMLERLGPPSEAADVVACGHEGAEEAATHVAGGAGQEDAAPGSFCHSTFTLPAR